MTDAVAVTFYGMTDIVGSTVTAFLTGLDCGDYLVASDGSITVPFRSDPDGLFTIARIQAQDHSDVASGWGVLATKIDVYVGGATHTYTVPCAIGFSYVSEGQVLRPAAESEIKSPQGSGLGKRRRNHQFAALVTNTVGTSFGTTFTNVTAANFTDAAGTSLDRSIMFSGVYWDTVVDDYSFDGMLCWSTTRPYPTTIVSLTGFMQTQEN